MAQSSTGETKLPVLEGADLLLDPVKFGMGKILFPILSDKEIMRYVLPPASTIEQADKTLGEIEEYGRQWAGWWAIFSKKNPNPAGLIMYYGVHPYNRHASIAYVVSSQYQRRGIAKQAAKLCLNFIFRELQINRAEAEVEIDNAASIGLLKSLNFRCEASCLRQRLFLDNEFRDVSMYSLLSSEWIN